MKPVPGIVAPAPLSAAEQVELDRLSKQVATYQLQYHRAGEALAAIQSKRLYRCHCKTFEEYCERFLDVARSTAYQLIAAAEVVANVRNCGQIPLNEGQARVLASLSAEDQRKAWKRALDTARGRLTAVHISRCVEEVTGKPADAGPGERSSAMMEVFESLPAETKAEVLKSAQAEAKPAAPTKPEADWREKAEKFGGWLDKMRREFEGEAKAKKLLSAIERAMDELGAWVRRMGA